MGKLDAECTYLTGHAMVKSKESFAQFCKINVTVDSETTSLTGCCSWQQSRYQRQANARIEITPYIHTPTADSRHREACK